MEKLNDRISSIFELRRFGLLLKRDFLSSYRGILIAMAAVSGFIILVSALSILRGESAIYHNSQYISLLFIGGYIVSSLAFKEMHQADRSYVFLTLPGSRLEKFASKLLTTSIGYAVGSLVFYTALAAVSEGINRMIFGRSHLLFSPFDSQVLLGVAVYLVTQSLFLVGSAYFKTLAFLKTSLALSLLVIALGLLTALILLIFFNEYFEGGSPKPELRALIEELSRTGLIAAVFREAGEGIWLGLKILFWAVLAPVCWTIGYFRLSEKEV